MSDVEKDKLQAEVEKLRAEVKKLNAETGKAGAEERKLMREVYFYPWAIATGTVAVLGTLFSAVTALIIKLM